MVDSTGFRRSLVALAVAVMLVAPVQPAGARTIVDDWSAVKVPDAPKLDALTIDAKTTALLVLDMVKQGCNDQARPRCMATVPAIGKLLKTARDSKTAVFYSLYPGPSTADILAPLAPQSGETVFTALADKFINTDLEKTLRERGITTVVVVGTAAHGAVLYTASHAAMLGFNVIVPVDGMSTDDTYGEQSTAWTLGHAPTVAQKVKLTSSELLKF
jgi:nicotinamidase-related amidase